MSSGFPDAGPFVSPDWLAANIDRPEVVVLDASFTLPGGSPSNDPAVALPGALRFDPDGIKDPASDLPHMLPPADVFVAACAARGIGPETLVVCYDAEGLAGAARCWWTFRSHGLDRIRVLNGGLKAWAASGHDLPPADPALPGTPGPSFATAPRPALLRSAAEVLTTLDAGQRVLDARSEGRFAGTAPEPRAGLRSGHMPGARSLPSSSLLDPSGFWMIDDATLAQRFAAVGGSDAAAIASCGSGMTACVIALAGAALGNWDIAVYDGSWTEWGARPDLPVVTGT